MSLTKTQLKKMEAKVNADQMLFSQVPKQSQRLLVDLQSWPGPKLLDAKQYKQVTDKLLHLNNLGMPVVEYVHRVIAKFRVQAKCKYCHKHYTYSALIGDNMHGCGKGSCVIKAMRDCF